MSGFVVSHSTSLNGLNKPTNHGLAQNTILLEELEEQHSKPKLSMMPPEEYLEFHVICLLFTPFKRYNYQNTPSYILNSRFLLLSWHRGSQTGGGWLPLYQPLSQVWNQPRRADTLRERGKRDPATQMFSYDQACKLKLRMLISCFCCVQNSQVALIADSPGCRGL